MQFQIHIRQRLDLFQYRSGKVQYCTIQPGVEEAERGIAGRKPVIIKQRDYARHDLRIGGQSDARARQ